MLDYWYTPGFAEQPMTCRRGQVTNISVVIRESKQPGNEIYIDCIICRRFVIVKKTYY